MNPSSCCFYFPLWTRHWPCRQLNKSVARKHTHNDYATSTSYEEKNVQDNKKNNVLAFYYQEEVFCKKVLFLVLAGPFEIGRLSQAGQSSHVSNFQCIFKKKQNKLKLFFHTNWTLKLWNPYFFSSIQLSTFHFHMSCLAYHEISSLCMW